MDNDELIEQTLIFDAIEWPQQAHMMSAPTRQHVGDGPWFPELDETFEFSREAFDRINEYLMKMHAERDSLRAEVAAQRDHILMMADHIDAMIEQDRIAWDQIERLRKDQHATVDTKPIRQETGMAQTLMRAGRAGAADLVLDHRLGTPQPDGDPVAPMSARKAYRWGMV